MKTVVIVHHTGEWGGGTKSLIDLCEMLRDDYNVIVCIPKGYPDFGKKIERYGCTAYEVSTSIPFINIYSGRPPLISVVTARSIKSLKGIKEFSKEILSLEPDVVIFNTLITAVSGRYLSRHTKVICIDRETLNTRFAKWIYRRLLDGKMDAITCLSEYERKKLDFKKSISGVFADCVRMDSLSDEERDTVRKREKIPQDKYAILFMGGLAKIKGADVILQAMEELDDRFTLLFAGEINESRLSRKQLIHDIKYPGQYFFKKRIIRNYYRLKGTDKFHESGLRDSIDDLIIASDIVVFPSTSVHQPRPCIEAGAYYKPVIISDYPETAEYFRKGYNALVFRPGNATELAGKIKYAAENMEEMKMIGENNRRMTDSKHNYYDCRDTICSLIEKVCNHAN